MCGFEFLESEMLFNFSKQSVAMWMQDLRLLEEKD